MYNKNKAPRSKANDRPRNSVFNLDLFKGSKTPKVQYSKEDLLEILNSVPFDKISVPVYTYKSFIFDNDSKGTMVIGYIKAFDIEKESFEVVIYGNYVEKVNSFKDAIVYPRVFVNEETGEVKNIIALDVAPIDMYADLLD